jgi:hypothetical protein
MRTCGRVVPFGVADIRDVADGTIMFIGSLNSLLVQR